MALSTLTLLSSAILGGATLYQAKSQNDQYNDAKEDAKKRETAAIEANALDNTVDDISAEVDLGRAEKAGADDETTDTRKRKIKRKNIGGLSRVSIAGGLGI